RRELRAAVDGGLVERVLLRARRERREGECGGQAVPTTTRAHVQPPAESRHPGRRRGPVVPALGCSGGPAGTGRGTHGEVWPGGRGKTRTREAGGCLNR